MQRRRVSFALVALGAHAKVGEPRLVERAIAIRIKTRIRAAGGAAAHWPAIRSVVRRAIEAAGAQTRLARGLALAIDVVLIGLRGACVLPRPTRGVARCKQH